MRVGLLYQQSGKGGELTPVVEQIVRADQLGFDTVWIEDRHGDAQILGSVPIVLAALAKRTRTIRLGSFTVLAIGHPVRTAEDFAMIDLLSGGRLNFGATAGSRSEDLQHYGVPFAEHGARFREALDIVLAAWVFDEFSYGGRYYQFPSHTARSSGLVRKRLRSDPYVPQWQRGPEPPDFLTVTPKPLQQPRPPVWILAETQEWVSFAADRGHSLVLPETDLRQLEAAANAYEAGLGRARRARSEVELAVIVDLQVETNRTSADTLERLHRLQGATGANHLIWRVPYPQISHQDMAAALGQFAAEVQPMLQA